MLSGLFNHQGSRHQEISGSWILPLLEPVTWEEFVRAIRNHYLEGQVVISNGNRGSHHLHQIGGKASELLNMGLVPRTLIPSGRLGFTDLVHFVLGGFKAQLQRALADWFEDGIALEIEFVPQPIYDILVKSSVLGLNSGDSQRSVYLLVKSNSELDEPQAQAFKLKLLIDSNTFLHLACYSPRDLNSLLKNLFDSTLRPFAKKGKYSPKKGDDVIRVLKNYAFLYRFLSEQGYAVCEQIFDALSYCVLSMTAPSRPELADRLSYLFKGVLSTQSTCCLEGLKSFIRNIAININHPTDKEINQAMHNLGAQFRLIVNEIENLNGPMFSELTKQERQLLAFSLLVGYTFVKLNAGSFRFEKSFEELTVEDILLVINPFTETRADEVGSCRLGMILYLLSHHGRYETKGFCHLFADKIDRVVGELLMYFMFPELAEFYRSQMESLILRMLGEAPDRLDLGESWGLELAWVVSLCYEERLRRILKEFYKNDRETYEKIHVAWDVKPTLSAVLKLMRRRLNKPEDLKIRIASLTFDDGMIPDLIRGKIIVPDNHHAQEVFGRALAQYIRTPLFFEGHTSENQDLSEQYAVVDLANPIGHQLQSGSGLEIMVVSEEGRLLDSLLRFEGNESNGDTRVNPFSHPLRYYSLLVDLARKTEACRNGQNPNEILKFVPDYDFGKILGIV
ncbi:MAG: hypothetical protein N2654_00305 [Deltaproteobacteria bacterium]|nr:hypothetical protein [Deltaproteobacteria bacterium]